MAATVAYQKRSDGNWYSGCTCQGLDPKNRIAIPDGSVELLFPSLVAANHYGPVTGIEYHVQPYLTAIDIDARDEAGFRQAGLAQTPSPTARGVLTRTGVVNYGSLPQAEK